NALTGTAGDRRRSDVASVEPLLRDVDAVGVQIGDVPGEHPEVGRAFLSRLDDAPRFAGVDGELAAGTGLLAAVAGEADGGSAVDLAASRQGSAIVDGE